jgi:hypothetical protein
MLQTILAADEQQRKEFCIDVLQWFEDDEGFLEFVIFNDE